MATTGATGPAADLHPKATAVLQALAGVGGRGSTSEIRARDHIWFDNSTVTYHADRLIEAGLAVHDGYAPADGHEDPNVYRLTDRGEATAAALDDPLSRADLERQVRQLSDRVEALEAETGRLDGRIDTLRDRVVDALRKAGLVD